MTLYFVFILGLYVVSAAPPLRLEIDCGSYETDVPLRFKPVTSRTTPQLDVRSLCSIIHSAIPKSIKDGKFLLLEEPSDQSQATNDLSPVVLPPPKGFKFRTPRVKVPKLKVPKLRSSGQVSAPRVGAHMFPSLSSIKAIERDEESSAERMEKFKKGMQKMLHVVKVLGQIDQYVSERTKTVVDILSRTLTE